MSKRVALVLIVAGVFLMPDVVAPTPMVDLLINVPLSMIIADVLEIAFWEAMIITWIVSYVLVIAGLLIFPYNTKKLLIGRAKAAIMFVKFHPLLMIASIIMLYVAYLVGNTFFEVHYETLKAYAIELVGSVNNAR